MNWQHKISDAAAQILSERHAPVAIKEMAWRVLAFAIRCRRSNPVSFALRPLFSHKHLRTGIGVLMAVLATGVAVATPFVSFAGEDTGGPVAVNILPEGELTISTTESVVLPVKNFRLTQGYNAFHPGIDMASTKGEPINPVMNGHVTQVTKDKYGYGQHVRVVHNNNYESLYAHMSVITVTVGQEVSTTTTIGQVGSTGRSSGPHLHLEVSDDTGRTINPRTLLEIK